MRDQFVAGASYAAATPQGDLVCSMAGAAFYTNGTPIPPCPGGGLLASDAARIEGRLCVAGHGTASLRAWLWNGIDWFELALSYGSPCVRFGPRGLYLSSHGATDNIRVYDPLTGVELQTISQQVGAEGIAAITGAGTGPDDVHSAKGWYGRHGFAFYTELGSTLGLVRIGQKAGDGILAQIAGGPLKRVAFGDSQFIGVHQDGDLFSISVSRFGPTPAQNSAGAIWLAAAEIAGLPDDVAVPPPPIVVVPPVIPTEPIPMAVPDEEDFVIETADAHPALLARMQASSHATDALRERLGENHPDVRAGEVATDNLKGQMCRVIVWGLHQRDARWGLLRKDSGAGAVRPDGVRHATDVAFWKPDGKVVDVLSDYAVGWNNRAGDFQPADRWVAPLFEAGDGAPVIVPPVDPPVDPPVLPPEEGWEVRFQMLEADVKKLDREHAALLVQLAAKVAKLEARTGTGIGAKLVITGITLDVDPTP